MVIELCGVLYKVVLGLDSSGDKVALTPWVNHYFKYFAHIFHCYKNIFLQMKHIVFCALYVQLATHMVVEFPTRTTKYLLCLIFIFQMKKRMIVQSGATAQSKVTFVPAVLTHALY